MTSTERCELAPCRTVWRDARAVFIVGKRRRRRLQQAAAQGRGRRHGGVPRRRRRRRRWRRTEGGRGGVCAGGIRGQVDVLWGRTCRGGTAGAPREVCLCIGKQGAMAQSINQSILQRGVLDSDIDRVRPRVPTSIAPQSSSYTLGRSLALPSYAAMSRKYCACKVRLRSKGLQPLAVPSSLHECAAVQTNKVRTARADVVRG